MPETATLQVKGKSYSLPVVVGTENEVAVDISKLRAESGVITLDDGYSNTGSCQSAITFIDGERGILRYRGIPIEQVAEHSTFAETAWLLIYGELPTADQLQCWSNMLTRHEMLHEGLYKSLRRVPLGRPPDGDPLRDDQRHGNLQPRHHQDGEPGDVPGCVGALAEQDPHDCGRVVPDVHRPADRLPEAVPRLLLELPAHDVLDPVTRTTSRIPTSCRRFN